MLDSSPLKNVGRACPICENGRAGVLHHQPFALPNDHLLPANYDVVCCAACGFVYADTFAGQSVYDQYYAQFSKYDDAQTSTGSGANELDAARLRETAREIAGFLKNPEARILDAGCAVGGLLHELKNLNFENGQGLDPSDASRKYARAHFGIEVHIGSIVAPELSLEGEFDCVVLSHVLEHVRDLEATFENLRKLTRDGSTLYLEVPDATRYREYVVAPFQDFNVEHINHFDATHLDLLASRFGFAREGGGWKTMSAAEGIPYPALFGWYRREEKTPFSAAPDWILKTAIEEYIALSQTMMDDMENHLKTLVGKEVIVWGAGQLALKLLAQTSLSRANIVCFVDGNPVHRGEILHGSPIFSPEEFAGSPNCNDGSTPVVIASTIHQDAIAKRITSELKWNNPLITLR